MPLIHFVAVVIGLFAIGEILYSLRHPTPTELVKTRIRPLSEVTRGKG